MQKTEDYFNLMGETPSTFVNGPGNRYLIHLQFCNLGCPGCYNPESWSSKINKLVNIYELADRILSTGNSLSISGGEPFLQSSSLLLFLQYLHKDNNPFPKGVLIFSGFTRSELENIPEYLEIMKYTSVIISGRYQQENRVYNSLLSSSNQEFIWPTDYNYPQGLIAPEELMNQNFEVIIEDDNLKLTGFPELNENAKKYLEKVGIKIIYKQ